AHVCLAQAVSTFIQRVLPRLPERFSAADLWQQGLALSYATELRVEGPDRAVQLFERYQTEYEALTQATLAAIPWVSQGTDPAGEPCYLASIAAGRRRRVSALSRT
ncbi:MAG: hypothetical protein GY824_29650, partial [Delftia sp.]|nr:hypothetical protein [Delftia sp.]